MISLSGGRVLFHHPEERIREYCDLEVYHGYDDLHSIDNTITTQDIEATKRIFSMIDQHGYSESTAILSSQEIPIRLAKIPDAELAEISDLDWGKMRANIISLFNAFHEIKYVGLAKAGKILHLKRPHLFPILDSYVVKFLTEENASNVSNPQSLTNLGMRTLDIAREDVIQNITNFKWLQHSIDDLPIPLTIVRMYDILCWTTWKWDVLGIRQTTRWVPTASGYVQRKSLAQKTLLAKEYLRKIKVSPSQAQRSSSGVTHEGCTEINTLDQFNSTIDRGEGYIVLLDTTGNKIHRASCKWLNKESFNEKVIINRKKNGRYFWCRDYRNATQRFRAKDCKSCI
jgi:hypothetical protein